MADEKPPPTGAPGQPDRRRPAPTIDLTATEIARESAPASAAETPSGFSEPAAQKGQAATEEMPPASAGEEMFRWLPEFAHWRLVGVGIAGAVLILSIVWLVLLVSGGGNDPAVLDARMAQLEQKVTDLARRPPPPNINSAVNDLAGRLQQLESEIAAVRAPASDPALANRTAAIEAQLKSLSDTAAEARRRADANAAALSDLAQKLAQPGRPEVDSNEIASVLLALSNRLDALENGAKTIAAELAKRGAENSDDRAARTAVIAAALALAVERGDPFAAELKAAQSRLADAKALAPLEPFAASGVPGANILARELSSLEPALLQAAGTAPGAASLLARLQAHAEKLVRIRPIDEVSGDDPAAIIARVEVKAMRGDLPGALAELGTLPAQVRAPAQAWIAKAAARAAAIEASRRFAADALAALKPTP
jgi:hypothetical protein